MQLPSRQLCRIHPQCRVETTPAFAGAGSAPSADHPAVSEDGAGRRAEEALPPAPVRLPPAWMPAVRRKNDRRDTLGPASAGAYTRLSRAIPPDRVPRFLAGAGPSAAIAGTADRIAAPQCPMR